jgi:hypothetical protein
MSAPSYRIGGSLVGKSGHLRCWAPDSRVGSPGSPVHSPDHLYTPDLGSGVTMGTNPMIDHPRDSPLDTLGGSDASRNLVTRDQYRECNRTTHTPTTPPPTCSRLNQCDHVSMADGEHGRGWRRVRGSHSHSPSSTSAGGGSGSTLTLTPLHEPPLNRPADPLAPHPGGRGGHGRCRAGDGRRGWVGDAIWAMVAAGDLP